MFKKHVKGCYDGYDFYVRGFGLSGIPENCHCRISATAM